MNVERQVGLWVSFLETNLLTCAELCTLRSTAMSDLLIVICTILCLFALSSTFQVPHQTNALISLRFILPTVLAEEEEHASDHGCRDLSRLKGAALQTQQARRHASCSFCSRLCGFMRFSYAGIQAFEIMAIAAVGNNLITYVFDEMHFPLSKSANIVTNFVGTIFILSLLGGFLSDSYLGSFWTMLIFGFVELSGFILLSVQAHLPQLRPPKCNMLSNEGNCIEAKGFKAKMFFIALYLVALGELFALTVLVWVQTRSGMDVGFGVSAAAMGMGLISLIAGMFFYRNKPPQGSIFTPIARVFIAAITKRKQVCPSNFETLHRIQTNQTNNLALPGFDASSNHGNVMLTDRFRFLDKACIRVRDERPCRSCTATEVEQVKVILSVIPIFACTIVFNTILAQLQTFSVQQGRAMNAHLGSSFDIPPASLQAIPYLILIFLVPFYEITFVPFARRFTGRDSGITPLQRIGVGLFSVTFSMVAAALVEKKRRDAALESKTFLSIFWVLPQFVIFGVSEMFTAVGLIEFFYKQALGGMQAFLTAMTYCSYSFGFYLSSLLVSFANKITSSGSSKGWLGDNDLNKDRLDLFYWVLAGLSLFNFFNYLFWSRWYSYNPFLVDIPASKQVGEENT
ncbi:hypothetical protein HPP92_004073 [Vanilla planifolia]|uniref:Uncharacterized protein n=1 Tax=Vanilla planifolia TaxID=51239 RepID=A0A835SD49_VANPL|nr:hypothetical protein HPP92_004073 [Vanilla planifolia]